MIPEINLHVANTRQNMYSIFPMAQTVKDTKPLRPTNTKHITDEGYGIKEIVISFTLLS